MRRLALVLAALQVAAGPATAAKRDRQVERGHELARKVCAACHAVEPGAASPVPKAPPFASREMQHVAGLEGRLETLAREGHYGMPPQPLVREDVAALLAYIEHLGRAEAAR
jgi:mono/diheme cytochrome c family protein